jgi:ribonucleotide monophosphatase NagD (HAD superfamily)
MGKPAPVIYAAAAELLQLPAEALLAVGDSLEHDIAGALGAGVRSLFVSGGIHAEQLLPGGTDEADAAALRGLCAHYLPAGTAPTFVMTRFVW